MKMYSAPGVQPTPAFEAWVARTAEHIGLGAIAAAAVGVVLLLILLWCATSHGETTQQVQHE